MIRLARFLVLQALHRLGVILARPKQRKLPPKCKDPGTSNIPCTIGNTRFEREMLDLGSSINVMPYSIYAYLNLGPLEETGIIIQLANRSNA